ncbi:oxidized purine nucleoside triphosphate hydrolase-like [Planococcus citri]|uniref:oxidized purine nucleoside triphosphate hydrolase-like n=1 Tax=Planococcus citri TaxID=170843 RepID=UPI0031F75077
MEAKFVFPTKKSPKVFTLIVVVNRDGEVLLGMKKRGFGIGKWNGFGGKVEQGESIKNCAIRELQEECGLVARSLHKHGIVWFDTEEEPSTISEVHLFTVDEYEGEISESDEMSPKWFAKNSLPFDCMWPSNSHWLPLVLDGKKFDAYFLYKNEREMIKYEVYEHK